MRLIPPKNIFSKTQWASIFSCLIAALLLWGSHFLFESSVLVENGLALWWVSLSYLGCIVGGFVALLINTHLAHYPRYFIFSGLFAAAQIYLQWVSAPWAVLLGLFFLGMFGSLFVGEMFVQLSPAFPDPKYNGYVNGLGYSAMNIVIFVLIVLEFLPTPIPNTILIAVLAGAIIVFAWKGKVDAPIPIQKPVVWQSFWNSPQTGNRMTISFFWGFFLTLPFYAAFNLIQHSVFHWGLGRFLMIVFITIAIVSVPNGFLLDFWGRKRVMLFGIGLLSMAFFVLFLPIQESVLGWLFPVILGVGTTLFLTSNSLIFIEMTKKSHLRDYFTVYYILMALGMLGGVVLGVVLEGLYLTEPIYLTVVLLFLFLIASITISQAEETLPNKEELEWKDCIQRIYLMYKSGVPIYSQEIRPLCPEIDESANKGDVAEELLSGTLITVSSILDEISQSKNPLKVIKREGMSILVEDSQNILMVVFTTRELSKIREKMQLFLQEFVDFFEETLKMEVTNQTAFLPAKKLIQKHFFYYW